MFLLEAEIIATINRKLTQIIKKIEEVYRLNSKYNFLKQKKTTRKRVYYCEMPIFDCFSELTKKIT